MSVLSEDDELDTCLYEMGGYLIAFSSAGERSLLSLGFFFAGSEEGTCEDAACAGFGLTGWDLGWC